MYVKTRTHTLTKRCVHIEAVLELIESHHEAVDRYLGDRLLVGVEHRLELAI